MGTGLKRIVIRGYKSIREVELELRPINVLIGANGAGKSNFLAFFRLMQQLARGELQRYVVDQGGPDKILHFGRKRTQSMQFSLDFTVGAYGASLAASSSGQLIFLDETAFVDGQTGLDGQTSPNRAIDLVGSGRESGLATDRSDPAFEQIRDRIENWRVYHFHDTTPAAAVKQQTAISNNVALTADAGNLAAFLKRIADTPAYQLIVLTIRRVAPFFKDFVLEPEDSAGRFVRLRWSHLGSDDVYDANDFSDGTLRFICLATLLLQPEPPGIIILDEPELGLHPFALKILAGLVRSLSARSQIIVSTQSVTFANQFAPEDMAVVDRVDEASRLRRLYPHELDAWLEDFEYGVGDLWEKNVIGGTPR